MKNCHTCKHLEWHDDDTGPDSGWGCNKRDEGGERREVLIQLESDQYRARFKRCFDAKEAA